MEFRPAQVFAEDELWHETSFGSEWVQFELSFGPGRVSARGRFWIGKGSVRLGPTWVYARYGFQSATGFGPTRVSARDMFRFIFFVSIWPVFSVSFRIDFNLFSFCFVSVGSISVFLFLFGRFILLRFGSI
ncbi:hypothetical protein HanRHA438_Chr04g0185991 [Helianthus annuus]|nr:hypothetical protein HanRHA438_Chr04g0185991 [Helianthus annuus]